MALAEKTAGAAGLSANFFDLPESVLRSRRNSKWNAFGPDILPAFVAEMDFAVAEPVQEADQPRRRGRRLRISAI